MIEQLSADYSISEICEALDWSRSGYYARVQRRKQPSARAEQNHLLVQEIERIHQENLKAYGSPRITQQLRQEGQTCSENRVARLMRQNGIKAKKKKAFRPRTTVRAQEELIAPNLLAELPPSGPSGLDQVWVSDITYIYTEEGWLYLAALMDLKSRKIVGWALEEHMTTWLVEKALDQAVQHRRPAPGLWLHSDRGSQYSSRFLQERLKFYKLRPSMGQVGYCYDNAAMEAFWSTLKNEAQPEEGYFRSKAEAKTKLFYYIEVYYNRTRLHSSLGYLSPEDYEKQMIQTEQN